MARLAWVIALALCGFCMDKGMFKRMSDDPDYPDQQKWKPKKIMEIACWMHFWCWRVNVSLVAVACSSISACTSSSWLVKLDRPMIESTKLLTLDHSLCAYGKTIWSTLPYLTGNHAECVWDWPLTSSACHMVTCGHNLPWQDLVPEYVQSIHCCKPFVLCMIHIVQQQEVVTYVSPVDGINIAHI